MTQIPRDVTLLFGLLLVTALAVGSGAFSAVNADRTATISVAGDDSALLGIESLASEAINDNGELEIQVTAQSTKTINPLLRLTNRGAQTVSVWIIDIDNAGSGSSGGADLIGLDVDNTGNVTFFNSTYGGGQTGNCENGVPSIEDEINAVELGPGEGLNVGLQANASDLSDPDEADLLDEMVIHADATVSGVSEVKDHNC